MATVYWKGPQTGDWDTATNWEENNPAAASFPKAGDTANASPSADLSVTTNSETDPENLGYN